MKRVLSNFMKKYTPDVYHFLRRIHFLRHGYKEKMKWSDEKFCDSLEIALEHFLDVSRRKKRSDVRRLKNDIISCYLCYSATPKEYFFFDFLHKSKKEREMYLTDAERFSHIDFTLFPVTRDKSVTYQRLKPFFKRETLAIRSLDDKEAFVEFASRVSRLFVKPLWGSLGQKARIIEVCNRREAELMFDNLLADKTEWQVEECIRQADMMAAWNPDAVNTVRIPSFLIGNKIYLLGPLFRTGTKGAVADNGGSGGIVSAIDAESGVLFTDGLSPSRQFYEKHPDTQLTYRGFQIPEWKSLLQIAENAHRELSEIRYLAFDFAYTEQGWVLVEANGAGGLSSIQVLVAPCKERYVRLMTMD